MNGSSLAAVQHWMNSIVISGGVVPVSGELDVDAVVVSTPALSGEERLGIYARGYVLRLLECLRADFPALRAFVGDGVFDAFARAYLAMQPSTSPSLYALSAGFARFLEETRPDAGTLDADSAALLDFPAELARLERAWGEVMRAPGIENDPPSGDVLSFETLFGVDLMVQATPCLRLLDLRFPLVDFLRRAHAGERPEPPAPRRALVALGRSRYRVHAEEIEPWQFAFLQACEQPLPLYAAAQRAAAAAGDDPSRVLAALSIWLPAAIELGYIRRVA
ncbi:MAG TPA: DNA-binding domain-containing protein [Thermoanaerobaculia bacterium]|jgi:hypothetical protein